jgi:hypothetical protein
MEFLQTTGKNSCVYLDTDMLLSQNLSELARQVSRFGIVFTGYSAHACIINDTNTLYKLNMFIKGLYSDVSNEQQLKSMKKSMVERAGAGGVSDMDMFYLFKQENPALAGSFPENFDPNPIDLSLDDTRGFVQDGDGFKKLLWSGRQPSAILANGKIISLATLHHQGKAKALFIKNSSKISNTPPWVEGLICKALYIPAKILK